MKTESKAPKLTVEQTLAVSNLKYALEIAVAHINQPPRGNSAYEQFVKNAVVDQANDVIRNWWRVFGHEDD